MKSQTNSPNKEHSSSESSPVSMGHPDTSRVSSFGDASTNAVTTASESVSNREIVRNSRQDVLDRESRRAVASADRALQSKQETIIVKDTARTRGADSSKLSKVKCLHALEGLAQLRASRSYEIALTSSRRQRSTPARRSFSRILFGCRSGQKQVVSAPLAAKTIQQNINTLVCEGRACC